MKKAGFTRGVLTGLTLGYFLDPRLGRRRRAVGADWSRARLRAAGRRLDRKRRYFASRLWGAGQRTLHAQRQAETPDDATLAHKVETEIFRHPEVPKGRISVNAENGVVYLRGEVPEQTMLGDLVARTRAVRGVERVESLLHCRASPRRRSRRRRPAAGAAAAPDAVGRLAGGRRTFRTRPSKMTAALSVSQTSRRPGRLNRL